MKSTCIKYKNLYTFYKKERLILKEGLTDYYHPIVWTIPILLSIILLLVSWFLETDLNTYMKNLISILPSLIGFLIASVTILITVPGNKIDKIHTGTHTYREIGGSIFFYATKIAIFLLIISFMSSDDLIKILNPCFYYFISSIVIFYFSKMIIAISFGLMFLSDIIQSMKRPD